MIREKLELYLHIPFCARKCAYCDFLSFSADEQVMAAYVEALIEEIKVLSASYCEYRVPSVFIGGGTPSILKSEWMGRIVSAVRESFLLDRDAEITIEANPGTLAMEKLTVYRSVGINRISMGLQSSDYGELKLLGRIHTFEQFLESYHMARKAGFQNINVDLMSALPGQTLTSWKHTLSQVTDLRPEHISAYSLIVEEGTPFYEKYGADRYARLSKDEILPDEDAERAMYHLTKTFLREQGYDRYEISNYARPGFECRHNIGYWDGTWYLGLGLGASSYVKDCRFLNERDLRTYLNLSVADIKNGLLIVEKEELTKTSMMEEFMFLGLRMVDGISPEEFQRRFSLPIEIIYGDVLKKMKSKGLMEFWGSRWKLTEHGIDVSNYVMSEFLL